MEENKGKRICPVCGREYEADAIFCKEDGTRLEGQIDSTEYAAEPDTDRITDQDTGRITDQESLESGMPSVQEGHKKKKHGKVFKFVVIESVVIICAAIVYVVLKSLNLAHPEFRAYSEQLADASGNCDMAVFDLNEDGRYEVAIRHADGSASILSYNSNSSDTITNLDEELDYINEAAGQVMTSTMSGVKQEFVRQLDENGDFTTVGDYYMSHLNSVSASSKDGMDEVDSYNQLIDGMVAPKWVKVTDDNISKYLKGDGQCTGTTKEKPEVIVPKEEVEVEVTKKPTTSTNVSKEVVYYEDTIGVVTDAASLEKSLSHFYDATGLQPFVYFTDNANGNYSPSDDDIEDCVDEVFDQYIDNQNQFLIFALSNRETGGCSMYVSSYDNFEETFGTGSVKSLCYDLVEAYDISSAPEFYINTGLYKMANLPMETGEG